MNRAEGLGHLIKAIMLTVSTYWIIVGLIYDDPGSLSSGKWLLAIVIVLNLLDGTQKQANKRIKELMKRGQK